MCKGERVLNKDIAVLMGAISIENQKLVLDGMIDAIKETKDNLFVFTNHATRRINKESIKGAYQIMELPDFEHFDGVIMALDTITYPPVASFVMDKLRASKKPAIMLDHPMKGFGCLQNSSFHVQMRAVEHLIKVHGCREIAYVRGPIGYSEGDKRFQGYLATLEKYDIPYREEYVYTGKFTLESGKAAAAYFMEHGYRPQAIVCANDSMAVGVLEYLKENHIRVPEDILLMGFDNSERAKYSSPAISSIDKNPYELGKRAIYEMLAVMDGKSPELIEIISEPSCRESCGCGRNENLDAERLKKQYLERDIYIEKMTKMINDTLADLTGVQKPEEVIPVLQKCIRHTGLKEFYLCLCDREQVFFLPETNMDVNFDFLKVNTDYTDKIELPFAYHNGEISSYKPFKKGMVLPKEVRKREEGGNYYVVTPLFFQNCCYGYCVSGNDKLALKSSMYYSWLMNFGVAFENIRKWMLLQDAVIRLNNVWSLDMLTQMYNRAGFYYEAKTILEVLKLQDSNIFVLFSDVDGLKKINDTYGHEAGDNLIKEMAACFKENLSSDMLAMRYGGDEFVIFGSYEDDVEVDYLIHAIQSSMERRNASGKNIFKLSASIGVSKYHAKDINELSDLIEIADTNMYEQKRKKREMRKRLEKESN